MISKTVCMKQVKPNVCVLRVLTCHDFLSLKPLHRVFPSYVTLNFLCLLNVRVLVISALLYLLKLSAFEVPFFRVNQPKI